MTPAARLQTAITLLQTVETTPRPADAVITRFFRERRYIGSKDRAALAERVYGVLRSHARLGWWLERLAEAPEARAQALAYGRLVEGLTPETLEGLCSGGQFAPASLTGAEKRWLKALEGHTLDHPAMPEAVRLECPPWAEPALRAGLGEGFAREMRALMEPAPLDIRINPLRSDREKVLAALKDAGIAAVPGTLSPLALRLRGRPALLALALHREGHIAIQDEGSQLVGLLVQAAPGQTVLDFCAGACGKTLVLAACMENRGKIFACDVLEGRLKRGGERLRQAGVYNVEAHPLRNEHDPWLKRHKKRFDRVLVDAPCSGTGTWRRNPDARWRPLGPGLETLLPLQASILASAARLVRPGGRLIYATCSLLLEENEEQIAAFLAAHPDFTQLSCMDLWPQTGLGAAPFAGPGMRLTPARQGTDGFFAAVLERRGEAEPPEKVHPAHKPILAATTGVHEPTPAAGAREEPGRL